MTADFFDDVLAASEAVENNSHDVDEFTAAHGVKLSESQKKGAINHPGLSVYFATAGSGKTETIAVRIALLALSLGEDKEKGIFASSFTKEAARNLGRRIERFLGRPTSAEVGTFHGLCYRLLSAHWRLLGYGSRPLVLSQKASDFRKKSILLEKTGKKKLKEIEDFSIDELDDWFYALSVAKSADDPEDASSLSGILLPENQGILRLVTDIFEEYEAANFSESLVDFDSIMTMTLSLLKKASASGIRLSGLPSHVFIDEAQDLDAIQWMLVDELRKNAESTSLIGDDDQAIYSWRGALPQKFVGLLKEADHVHILPENRRSAPVIVKLADSIVRCIPADRRVEKGLKAFRETEGDVRLVVVRDYDLLMSSLVKRIKKDDEMKITPLSEHAFVFRNGRGSEAFRKIQGVLLREGVPMIVRGGGNVFEEDEARFVRSVLNIVSPGGFYVRAFWLEAAEILGISDAAAINLVSAGLSKDRGITGFLSAVTNSRIKQDNKEKMTNFIYMADRVRENSEKGSLVLEEFWTRYGLKDFLMIIAEDGGKRAAAARRERGGITEAEEAELAVELANSRLQTVEDAMKPMFDLPLSDIAARFALDESAQAKNDVAKVVVTTAHSSKGLEWKNVYLFDAKDEVWPIKRSKKDLYHTDEKRKAAEDEEKRLLYVAMTRAKDNLMLVSDTETGYGYKKEPARPIPYFSAEIKKTWEALRKEALSRPGTLPSKKIQAS